MWEIVAKQVPWEGLKEAQLPWMVSMHGVQRGAQNKALFVTLQQRVSTAHEHARATMNTACTAWWTETVAAPFRTTAGTQMCILCRHVL